MTVHTTKSGPFCKAKMGQGRALFRSVFAREDEAETGRHFRPVHARKMRRAGTPSLLLFGGSSVAAATAGDPGISPVESDSPPATSSQSQRRPAYPPDEQYVEVGRNRKWRRRASGSTTPLPVELRLPEVLLIESPSRLLEDPPCRCRYESAETGQPRTGYRGYRLPSRPRKNHAGPRATLAPGARTKISHPAANNHRG